MKIAVLASGRGSNAAALFKAKESGILRDAEFACLISDKPDAPALEEAKLHGVESVYIPPEHQGAKISETACLKYIEFLKSRNVELVVLAGFMRILPPAFVEAFQGNMINLHPSLLPSFKGKDAIKQAFEYGVKICGCTVHFVSNELDAGKIIAQKAVEILPYDTLQAIESRVHEAEHNLLISVVSDFCSGKFQKNA